MNPNALERLSLLVVEDSPADAEVRAVLPTVRLLTLTGPGGTGKTRLSIEAAHAASASSPAASRVGSVCRPLDPPRPERDSPRSSASSTTAASTSSPWPSPSGSAPTGCSSSSTTSSRSSPAAAGRRDAPRPLPRAARSSSRAARCCACAGEREYPVPPLGVPDPALGLDVTAMADSDVDRAVRRACPGGPTGLPARDRRTRRPSRRSVARLDGLPLAIELAAARITHPRARGACWRGSSSRSASWPAAPATCRRASRRCATRSPGATTCSTEPETALFRRLAVVRRRLGDRGGRRRCATRRTNWASTSLDGLGLADRQEPHPPGRRLGRGAPLPDAPDDPRVRAGAARGDGRDRRVRDRHLDWLRRARTSRGAGDRRAGDAALAGSARGRARQHPRSAALGHRGRSAGDRAC